MTMAWNDPPPLSYKSQPYKLNKRVAFPLSNSSVPQNEHAQVPLSAPPLPSFPAPATKVQQVLNVRDHERFEEAARTLRELVHSCPELPDVSKKLDLMEAIAAEGKLDDEVRACVVRLTEAIQNGDFETADEIHKTTMIKHAGTVSGWMVGIKRLIFHLSVKKDLISIDEAESRDDS